MPEVATAYCSKEREGGVPEHHEYGVIGWDSAKRILTIYNPWGKEG